MDEQIGWWDMWRDGQLRGAKEASSACIQEAKHTTCDADVASMLVDSYGVWVFGQRMGQPLGVHNPSSKDVETAIQISYLVNDDIMSSPSLVSVLPVADIVTACRRL